MKFFWYLIFAQFPILLFLGMMGVFGDEAKEAAEELAVGMAILLAILIVAIGIYFLYASIFAG